MSLPTTSQMVSDALQRISNEYHERGFIDCASDIEGHALAVAQALFPAWRRRPLNKGLMADAVAEALYDLAAAERAYRKGYEATLAIKRAGGDPGDAQQESFRSWMAAQQRVESLARALYPAKPKAPRAKRSTK